MNTFTKSQSGAVLIISLVMLLALTIIGMTSTTVTGLEEKMAANSKDINLSFQAAEAALRAAESSLSTRPTAVDRTLANTAQGASGYYTILNNDELSGGQGQQTQAPSLRGSTTTCDPSVYPTKCFPAPVPTFYTSVDWYATSNAKYITYNNVISGGKRLIGLYRAPEYIIEEIACVGSASNAQNSLESNTAQADTPGRVITYRITARGWGSYSASTTTLQSVVKVTY